MVSERTFAKVCDYIPFSFPNIEKKKPMKIWFKVALLLVQIWNIWVVQGYFFLTEVNDLESFTLKTNLFSYGTSTAVYACYNFLADYLDNISLEELQNHDPSLNLSLSLQFDNWLFLLLATMFLHLSSVFYLLGKNWNEIVWILDLLMSCLTLTQVTAFNLMMFKRLKVIVNTYQENPDGEDVEMNHVRKMSAMLKRLEHIYSVRTGTALLREFIILTHSLLIYWKIYGLKHDSATSIEFNHTWITILAHHQFVWEFLTLGLAAGMISNEVSRFMGEIDRKIIYGELSMETREKLHTNMLELHHTSTDFKVMDLFTVDTAAMTQVCGFMLSMVMVFIQFMK